MDLLYAMGCFVATVDSGSFSAAARRLDMAPSSVARQVDQLESRLGVRLLVRSTRRLRLTEAGERYVERARRILGEVDEAGQLVSGLQDEPRGTLRLDVVSPFGRRYVAPMLAAYHRRCPGVRVVLSLSDRLVDLHAEQVDLAIRVGVLEDSRLVARRIAPSRLWACASPAYLQERGRPRSPAELAGHDCLGYGDLPGPVNWRVGGERLVLDGPLLSNDVESLLGAARGGLGLVNLPDWVVAEDVQAGRLEVLFEGEEEGAALYALYPERRFLPAKVRSFIDFLVELIGDPPVWRRATPPSPSPGADARSPAAVRRR
ncbi:LysR family transcriptional regulator [Thioalbus denitrificans]|uniref:LysR family transcriptional regulator n=1 Tax=Thioalbus denitrificans TaxID=547122 RepID=A0A369CDL0_9GAMM|nr:LysR family transcriptional regulator [Thioalbus denitrificans]RCX31195.1 LysR family transcriptional regulator [Thioalbus denitrificans]